MAILFLVYLKSYITVIKNLVIFVSIYNLESYGYFQLGICGNLCHSFHILIMSFVGNAAFFPIKFLLKIYFRGKFATEIWYFHFFFLTYVPLEE